MSDKLKQCPFCGGKAKFSEDKDYQIYSVNCTECDAGTNSYGIKRDAIDAWNKRIEPTFTPDEREAIKEMFEEHFEGKPHEEAIIKKCDAAMKRGD